MQNNKYINDQINFSEKNDNIPQNIQNLNTNPNTYSEKNQNIIKGNDNSKINFQISKNNDQRKFCVIFCNNLNSNSILIINNIKNSNKKFFPAFLIILLYNISFHTYLFFNAILFSDKYISERNQYKKGKEIQYIITKEYDRIILITFICFLIIRILRKLFDSQSYIYENELILDDSRLNEDYFKKIKSFYICRCFFSHFIICLLHLVYTYFILVFGMINNNIQLPLFISMIISLIIYAIFYFIYCLIISFFIYIFHKHKIEWVLNFIKN